MQSFTSLRKVVSGQKSLLFPAALPKEMIDKNSNPISEKPSKAGFSQEKLA